MADSHLAEPLLLINKPVTKLWARSQSKLNNIHFTWIVNNFSYSKQKIGEILQSPTFSADASDNEVKWCLRLYPKGKNEETKEHLAVFLHLSPQSPKSLEVVGKYKISILNVESDKTISTTSSETRYFDVSSGWGTNKCMELETLQDQSNGFLTGDELTILCEISFASERIHMFDQKSNVKFEVPECNLGDELGNLLVIPKFSDVTLVVGEHEFQAHKVILASRSDVFAAMFEHEMQETKLNRVTITDIDHEVLQEMLRFIYTGDAPKLNEMADQLLAAADKYALRKLKVISEEALFAEISIETAAETLVLADLHNASHLKDQTICYINVHARAVIKTKGWQNMIHVNSHSHLIAETFEALFN